LKACRFTGNLAYAGGAVYSHQGKPILDGCRFESNRAFLRGGAMYNRHAHPVLFSCDFRENTAQWTDQAEFGQYDGSGGAMYNLYSNPTVQACTFSDNSAFNLGGAVHNRFSAPAFSECQFQRNIAQVTVNTDLWGSLSSRGDGGGIYNFVSGLTLTDCTFTMNHARNWGGGVYAGGSDTVLRLIDCSFSNNTAAEGGGIYAAEATTYVEGSVSVSECDILARGVTLRGSGVLQAEDPGVSLVLDSCRVRCGLEGPHHVRVPLGSELVIEDQAVVDLAGEGVNGTITCEGLLRAKDNAEISDANIVVARASFEGNAIIVNSVIEAEGGMPYGQFFVEDSVIIQHNTINADGDRYLDMDPCDPDSSVEVINNRINVVISEGQGNTRGGLLEARGFDEQSWGYEPNEFFCAIDVESMPEFSSASWTLEKLELKPEAKVNLTNRFDFGNGGFGEAMYVKQLVLREGSVLNTAYNRLYYGALLNLGGTMVNLPLLGFSLNMIRFDDEAEFVSRIVHNNYVDPVAVGLDRIHVERVTGLAVDPNGVMRMRNLVDVDPDSPTHGEIVHARAKGVFAKSSEDRVLVTLDYLFESDAPGTELLVYLSDVPELQAPRDPARYVEVGRVRPPRPGRPGSVGSGRFGTFHRYVHRRELKFVKGTLVELELVGSNPPSVLINDFDPQVQCHGPKCMDLDGSWSIDHWDLLAVIRECGTPAEYGADGSGNECVDASLSSDGYADSLDVVATEWEVESGNEENLCPADDAEGRSLPLTSEDTSSPPCDPCGASAVSSAVHVAAFAASRAGGPLLILGKSQWSGRTINSLVTKMPFEHIYVVSEDRSYVEKHPLLGDANKCAARLVRGSDGSLYQVSVDLGVLQLHDDGSSSVVVAPGQPYTLAPFTGSRYPGSVDVYVGLCGSASEPVGRPVWDAAFADG
jgi:predicted outer membrane repeat protein